MRGVEPKTRRSLGPQRFQVRLALSGLIFSLAFACVAQDSRSSSAAGSNLAAQATDAKSKLTKGDSQVKSSAESARKKQIADESGELLTMALALKAEVDKTTKDTLSLNVIKKADQIEKLAKSVKEKMKQSSGS